ncbi:MAG: O-linked N-acetylglucosamine transferase, SPINDLY family protein [Aphanizomenon flos-aquae KM1D3_PB]|uniref:O-linked N-acetylglucosamine transferase, SPINDLY family protein n=1 Tax=Aphanizomenon flos-aquae TaxID=1176 RepID=UPI000543E64D|nr:O-linked N-acetylglucosamine transferase [Aphanizomenon flos-aquae]KHG41447.1 O-linked N-acetylglucosamine transferase, SPINDLY family protein [Aphanizomenon flos-aquae 2012/KM1/D3]QSV73273.1 MAG: O-linked N-acetylglucosamine transferase, SPINDLY family protein [Aphanizomenon flos-aquae KM1D3_PB]
MNTKNSFVEENLNDWQKQAEKYLIAEKYGLAASLYEKAIDREPDVKSHYWHLGLMLLLQDQETEAQITWLMALSETEDETDTTELLKVLETEAERRINIEDYHLAWAIRQHICEIAPENINNLLYLVNITLKLDYFNKDRSSLLESLIKLLSRSEIKYDANLFLNVVKSILHDVPIENYVFHFIENAIKYFTDTFSIIDTVMIESIKISHFKQMPDVASRLAELCLEKIPTNRGALIQLSYFYQNSQEYIKGIEIAKRCCELAETLSQKVCDYSLIIRGLLNCANFWEEACLYLQNQVLLAKSLLEEKPDNIDIDSTARLFCSLFFLPYVYDNPQRYHELQNKIIELCHSNFIDRTLEISNKQSQLLLHRTQGKKINNNSINIGYLSYCLKRHSVGWLSRWIFRYHNADKFKVHSYFLHESNEIEGFTKDFFVKNSYKFYQFGAHDNTIWDQIQADNIDILIDLDSLTLDRSCEIMSIRSAPIQVTWLGWDASGLPSVDYFIADPYVLPESAQNYYSETIWRLPQTYIAVDGFEVGVPNLRREHLNIPSDAILYLMNQKGYKRHPDHIKLQMRIIKEVTNSYLLIKGEADTESSKEFFERIAEEAGVDFSRLIFLPAVPHELIHRANLAIADVVLDTYPYNGATTTLETLWMGIPMVTRVGQQFAARNSYTMMVNAGITEGIAWSEDEYVEWGVRLGKDEKLRQQISWKLRQSRHTAPLWNAKQFTRDMETAYEQMWQRYLDSK